MTSNINEKLRSAVLEGDLEQVKALIEAGADINYRYKDHRNTVLHLAAIPEITNLLLFNKANVNTKDRYGQTPLCCAVARPNGLEVVRILLSAGAFVNIRMVRGNTSLHYAPNVILTEVLLQNRAIVNAMDDYGRTPLHSAIIDGKGINVVRTLLSAGADVHVKMGSFRNSLLHYADSLEITRELLSQRVDVNVMTNRRQTPLHYAVKQMKEVAVVRELLKNGAHVNARDIERNTALVYAVRSHNKNFDVIKVLLEYGAFINEVHFDYRLTRFCTILDSAINHDLPCAKLIVKIYLIKTEEDDNTAIDLDPNTPYTKLKNFSCYIDACVNEIFNMKTDKLTRKLTVYDLVVKKNGLKGHTTPIYSSYRTLEKEILEKYPIYHDIILSRIKLCLERGLLLNKLRGLQISTKSNLFSDHVNEVEVTLNSDCTHMVAMLLSDDDLWNLLTVLEVSSS